MQFASFDSRGPMFGANCANVWLPRLRNVDPSAYLKNAARNRFHGNQPDWDLSRAHAAGWQAWLNPGHPAWRDALASAIEALLARLASQSEASQGEPR